MTRKDGGARPVPIHRGRSYRFTRAIVRKPCSNVAKGLRATAVGANECADNPDPIEFARQHDAYIDALKSAGLAVTVLPTLEDFPDSVFVEDAALCLRDTAIVLRPAAPTRMGEAAAITPALKRAFATVIELPGPGTVDGGDILVTDAEALIGLSARTDAKGFDTLASILVDLGIAARRVDTPSHILHFKTDCGLLDGQTILATPQLAATNCFADYTVIETAAGEEASANCIRVNDKVFISAGYRATTERLSAAGFAVVELVTSQAAKIEGGLSCMSLRF